MKTIIISLVSVLIIFGSYLYADKKIMQIRSNRNIQVYCIEGYKYVTHSTQNGTSIVQMFKGGSAGFSLSTKDYPPQPIECR